jgi:hypothetical protein
MNTQYWPDTDLGCSQTKPQAVDFVTTTQVEVEYSNKITNQYVNRTVYTTVKQPNTKKIRGCNDGVDTCTPDLSILFSSSSSVVNTQIINLSILTTVSIVLSTAATLWGSQEKIKAGIALIKAKIFAKKEDDDVTKTNMAQA